MLTVCMRYLLHKRQAFEVGECTLPPLEYSTRAFWIDICPALKRTVEDAELDMQGGIHASNHAIMVCTTTQHTLL
jgi:hypothetical protein